MTKMIFTIAEQILDTGEEMEDNLYYMAAFDRVKDELTGVFRYPYRWLSAHAGNAIIFKIITKAEYETYLEFGIEEITMPDLTNLGACVDDSTKINEWLKEDDLKKE